MDEIARGARAEAQAESVAIVVEVPADLAPVRANAGRLERVLSNLLRNALRHTPAGGTVRILATATGDTVEVEVADTGAGIRPADRERIFEPFFQGGPDRSRNRPGAGLGLSICRLIVLAHGGRIWLGDAAEGTSVRFTLPWAAALGAAEDPPASATDERVSAIS